MHVTSIYSNQARLASSLGKNPASPAGRRRPPFQKGILIVEDHAAVRTFLRAILSSCGYHVFEADGEAQAFRIWNKHFHQIDLLLTDICIPYLTTGVELAKKLRNEKSWLQIIYITGFSREIVAADEILLVENINFFRKPFAADKLLDAVRKCFAGLGQSSPN